MITLLSIVYSFHLTQYPLEHTASIVVYYSSFHSIMFQLACFVRLYWNRPAESTLLALVRCKWKDLGYLPVSVSCPSILPHTDVTKTCSSLPLSQDLFFFSNIFGASIFLAILFAVQCLPGLKQPTNQFWGKKQKLQELRIKLSWLCFIKLQAYNPLEAGALK